MLDAAALIEKHRAKGVLVDTNLLVLFLVGTVNRQRILNFKRTGDFAIEDYDLLVRLVAWFGRLISTPHVLSQVSDLTDLSGNELTAIRELFNLLNCWLRTSKNPTTRAACWLPILHSSAWG